MQQKQTDEQRFLKGLADISNVYKNKQVMQQIKTISNAIKNYSKIRHKKYGAQNRLLKKMKHDMGYFAYRNWKKQLKKSGIHLRKLSIQNLRNLAYTTHDLIRSPRKLPGLPLPQVPNATTKVDFNNIKGGHLSVRFADLPKAVVVNQMPYYSYNPNRQTEGFEVKSSFQIILIKLNNNK